MKEKQKIILDFQKDAGKINTKGLRNREGTNFILLAELPDKILYAATINSSLSNRYEKNLAEDVEEIALVRKKGGKEKYLQVVLGTGEEITLQEDNFVVLFHIPENETDSEDYALIFNHPKLLGRGAHFQIFLSDQENQNAASLFWLVKEFVFCEGEEDSK